jgi:hypothetical protein
MKNFNLIKKARYISLFILFIVINQCTTSAPRIISCKIDKNLSSEKTDPKWFIEKENGEFYYVVKNKEYSGDAKLAEVKNRYISEILLANKIADDFMSCSDQNKAFSYIRNSKDINELQKFKNGKLIKNLIGQCDTENNVTIEENNKFISYIKIVKVKK